MLKHVTFYIMEFYGNQFVPILFTRLSFSRFKQLMHGNCKLRWFWYWYKEKFSM